MAAACGANGGFAWVPRDGSPVSVSIPRTIAFDVVAISAGENHAAFITADGSLWMMGSNAVGQLGSGSISSNVTSTPVKVANDVVTVATGTLFTAFVTADGTLWGMGEAFFTGPGVTPVNGRYHPTPVAIDTNVRSVAAGYRHMLYVKHDGTLWGMGDNNTGELGDGSLLEQNSPVLIASGVASAATGPDSGTSYFVKSTGEMWGTGRNHRGQLGDPNGVRFHASPIFVSAGVTSVAMFGNSTLFVRADHTLWGLGTNEALQFGIPDPGDQYTPVAIASDVASAASGLGCTLFVKTDGTLWAMGANHFGQLGGGTTSATPQGSPIQVGTGVAAVAAGENFTLILMANGQLRTVGYNGRGQLGDRQSARAPDHILLGADVVTIADSGYSQLIVRADGSLAERNSTGLIAPVPGISNVRTVHADVNGTSRLYLKNDDTLWMLSRDGLSSQLATGVRDATAGFNYVAYVRSDGTLWGKGGGSFIRFGTGTAFVQVVDRVSAISGGPSHLLFIRTDNTLWGMGSTAGGLASSGSPQSLVSAPGLLENGVMAAIAGEAQNLTIRSNRSLWTRGAGWATSTSQPPAQVDTNVIAAAGDGYSGTWYVKSDGTLSFRSGISSPVGATATTIAAGVVSVVPTGGLSYAFIQQAGTGTAPAIVTGPAAKTLRNGASHILAVAVSGSEPLAYAWSKDGLALAWATTDQLVIPCATPEDAGQYRVRVTNSAGTVTSAPAAIAVAPPSAVVQWITPANIVHGTAIDVVQLNATTTTTGTFAYSVQPGTILPAGTHVLRVDFTPTDLGNFSPAAAEVQLKVLPVVTPGQAGTTTTVAGESTTLTVSSPSAGASYQWQREIAASGPSSASRPYATTWVDLPGATGGAFTLPSTQRFNAGNYRVIVTIDGAAATSIVFTVVVNPPAPNNARLLNLSTRGLAQSGANQLFPGFVIGGTGTKRLLIRAVGPSLANLGFTDPVIPDPRLQLRRYNLATDTYEDYDANDDWADNANAAAITAVSGEVFAFALTSARDAALLVDLPAGQYSVIGGDKSGDPGIAIVELYDTDPSTGSGQAPTSRLVNISNRGFAGVGDQAMIPGFVVSSEGSKTLLVRVVGPTLADAPFSVPGTMADPKLDIFPGGASTPILANDNWGDNPDAATTAQIATQVGAFALAAGSKDAAFVVTLPPGSYTVVGSSATAGGTGVVLVEVYVVP